MGNQQALTVSENAWMCGFFDGEGNVNFNVTNNATANKIKTKRHTVMIPRLTVANTDYATIMYWKSLCEKVDIGVHIGTRKRTSINHKQAFVAMTNGYKRCRKLVDVLHLYCVTKKKQLEIMAKWLEHRRTNYHYDMRDYEFYLEFMRAIDGRGPNDSTLRRLHEACTAPIHLNQYAAARAA